MRAAAFFLAALTLSLAIPHLLQSAAAFTQAPNENVTALRETVRRQPLDSRKLARLAVAELRAGKRSDAIRAYEGSLKSGRIVFGLMQARLILGVALWPHLSEEQRRLTAGQAYLLWRMRREDFLRLARLAPFMRPLETMLSEYYPQEVSWFRKRRGGAGFLRDSK